MKHIKKLYAILLCISLMLSLPIMVYAESSVETEEVLEWTVSDDQSTLYYGDQVYSRYELYPYDWFRPYHFYEYSQDIKTDYEYLDTVGHPAHVIESQVIVNHDIAVVYDYVGNDANYRVYVTEQGAASLKDFRTGHYSQYHLADGYSMSAPISSNLVQDWDIHWDLDAFVMNGYTKEATELGKMDHYEIIGYDETMTFAHVVGAVFDDNGTYLFVDYDSLDNSYFDAYGNLSFRQGSVPVLVLDQQDENAINEARAKGIKVGMIRPITLWPFPEKAIAAAAEKVKQFISVELSMGQMIEDVRLAANGKAPVTLCNRTGGMIPAPEQVLAAITEAAK